MRGYLLPLTCPSCCGELAHVNATNPGPVGSEAAAVARCDQCDREVGVFVQLRLLPKNDVAARRKAKQRAGTSR